MNSHREVTDDCIAIVFYGIDPDAGSLLKFYVDLIDWFQQVECPADKLTVKGPGYSGKIVGFKRSDSRLRARGFSEIDSFEVYSILPGSTNPGTYWWATAHLCWLERHSYFVLQARSSVTTLEDDRLARLIASCAAHLKPAYGIGYHCDFNKGPFFYAVGVIFTTNYGSTETPPRDEAEKKAIGGWGLVGCHECVYLQGLLRDVYPQNYLTEPQLMRQVQGKSLEHWISSDSSRGTLTKLDQRMQLWRVPDAQVQSVRGELKLAGLIFDRDTWLQSRSH